LSGLKLTGVRTVVTQSDNPSSIPDFSKNMYLQKSSKVRDYDKYADSKDELGKDDNELIPKINDLSSL
jgi:hypothetical protein